MNMEQQWYDANTGNQNIWRQACPSPILSTTDPTKTGLGLNLCLCEERLVTSHLNHGMAVEVFVCNECFVFDITLCSHFIKILFYNIILMDPESLGHVGWMAILSILNIILVTVSLGLVVLVRM